MSHNNIFVGMSVGMILFAILVLICVSIFFPLGVAWALNTLFSLSIPVWSIKTWFAVSVIGLFLRGNVSNSNRG